MKTCIEVQHEGRWIPHMEFSGPDQMEKGRVNFNSMLRNKTGEPARLIVVHSDHNGSSESAARLLR